MAILSSERFGDRAGKPTSREREMRRATLSTVDSGTSASETLRRARALLPTLAARQQAAFAARDVPAETIADFEKAGLLRLLQPRRFGGAQAAPILFSEVIQELALGCASSAWVCAVLGEHAWLIASFPEQAQMEVWGADPFARASSSLAPKVAAIPVAGGYRLTGRWPFSSGSSHAQWAIVGAFVDSNGGREARYMLVPMDEIKIIDDWHVLGLAATGSRTLELSDVFVPEHRSVSLAELTRGESPGRRVHPDYPLLRAPRGAFAIFSQAPVAVSLGRRALDLAVDALINRVTRVGTKAAESEVLQSQLAESAAEIDMATLVLDHSRKLSMDKLNSGEPFTAEDTLARRRDVAFALRHVRMAVERLCRLTGGQWVYDEFPLQSVLRDVLATSAHLTANFDGAMIPWGRMRLGLDSTAL